MEVVIRKITDSKGGVNNVAYGLRQNNFELYVYIRRSVDQALLAVASGLKKLTDREAKELQRSVPAALRDAARGA